LLFKINKLFNAPSIQICQTLNQRVPTVHVLLVNSLLKFVISDSIAQFYYWYTHSGHRISLKKNAEVVQQWTNFKHAPSTLYTLNILCYAVIPLNVRWTANYEISLDHSLCQVKLLFAVAGKMTAEESIFPSTSTLFKELICLRLPFSRLTWGHVTKVSVFYLNQLKKPPFLPGVKFVNEWALDLLCKCMRQKRYFYFMYEYD